MAHKPGLGDAAPDFTLPDEEGRPVRLSEALALGPVMLVFYPGDFTPVCTKQLCSYRDDWSLFSRFQLQLLGISDDPVEKHRLFRDAQRLPFPLLADPERRVISLYSGASLLAGGRANRANYIISRDGLIRYAHTELIAVTRRKPEELLLALEKLQARGLI
jgi:peroxiredoxin Q/BCP